MLRGYLKMTILLTHDTEPLIDAMHVYNEISSLGKFHLNNAMHWKKEFEAKLTKIISFTLFLDYSW